ncbi:MAG: hydroxymethylbilane synthase [Micromonosporaceae bacterium]
MPRADPANAMVTLLDWASGLVVAARPYADPVTSRALRLGTRGSPMALAQNAQVAAQLAAAHPDVAVEEVVISTHGDRRMGALTGEAGGKGAFVREISESAAAHLLADDARALIDAVPH